MSAVLATPAPPAATRPAASTLERRLDLLLAEAVSYGQAECPICGGSMTPSGHTATGSGEPRELACGACDTRLS